MTVRTALRTLTPRPVRMLRRRVLNYATEGPLRALAFTPPQGLSRRQGFTLARRLAAAHDHIDCAHTHAEMASILRAIFALPPGVPGAIVEAGCYKGGSTAKLSIAAEMTGRRLVAFDSFEGLPENEEEHGITMFGEVPNFSKGRYGGTLEEVAANVRRFGEPGCCEFIRGLFDETMSSFSRPVAVAFIDVDLQSSTKTCLRYLYPLLAPGGSIFSHDGHLPLCAGVIGDERFWTDEVGWPMPVLDGLGTAKLVRITKPAGAAPV